MAVKFTRIDAHDGFISFAVDYELDGIVVPRKIYSVNIEALADGRTTIEQEKEKAEQDAQVRWQRIKTQLEVEI